MMAECDLLHDTRNNGTFARISGPSSKILQNWPMQEPVNLPLKLSLKELVEHYEGFLKECERKSAETRGTYQRALREFLSWFAVDKRFQFRVRDVERYKRYLSERKRLQPVSIATYLTAVRRFCQYLIDVGILSHNPARRVVGGPRPTSHSRTYLTREELATLLESVDRSDEAGLRDYAIIRLMLDAALAEKEIILSNVGDIDRAGTVASMRVQGKGRRTKDESVSVPATALDAVDEYLASRFLQDAIDPEAPLVASMSNRTMGARMTPRGVRAAVNKWLQLSGVKGDRDRRLTPFSLRHTAALLMIDEGATVDELMRRMRIEWEPTALLYYKLRGVVPSRDHSNDVENSQ